ncbi:TIGR03756 family integrating conjugative element protein [Legionella drancourtii]|nr:TIGR03756 family integrating conjugative element protein [Legionella drancourtii]
MSKTVLGYLLMACTASSFAFESTKPVAPISTPQMAVKVLMKLGQNSRIHVIGACIWQEPSLPPKITAGPAISQFIPDLIVTVSNNPGENPWVEANNLFENKLAVRGYQSAFQTITGMPLGFGDGTGQLATQHINEDRTRVVSVIGSPGNFYQIKGVTHHSETVFMNLYYSSLADAVADRANSELLYLATHPTLLIGHHIGTPKNHWGHEFPRLMRVTQSSRFRASVVAAMHAADIVTNEGLHVKQSTKNSCGPNCVVSNVVFDPKQEHLIWQEVYPNNRNITPGKDENQEQIDDEKGNGNYVFVVWRQYKGCVKQKGKLIAGMPKVGKPKKR